MTTEEPHLDDILDRGCRALRRELGTAGFVQFMRHFQMDSGDYTADRHLLLTETVDEIFDLMESRAGPAGDAQ